MKQKKVAVVISYFEIIISTFINIIYTPALIRRLGGNEYGIYSVCASMVEYVSMMSFGYGNAYFRYYSKLLHERNEKEIDRLNGFMLRMYIILAFFALAIGCIIIFNVRRIIGVRFSDNDLPLFRQLLLIMTLTLAVNMPTGALTSMITARDQYVYYRLSMLFKNITPMLLVMLMLKYGYRSRMVALVLLIVNVALLISNLTYCEKKLRMRFVSGMPTGILIKEILGYSFFVMVQSVIDYVNWSVDKIILARICGGVAVTRYTIGVKVNSVIQNMTGAIHSVSVPKAHKMIAFNRSDNEISLFFARIGKIQFCIMLYLFSVVYFWGRPIIHTWVGLEYDSAYIVLLLLMIPELIYFSQTIGLELLRAKGKNQFLSFCYLMICVLNILISIPLTKHFEEVGAALGTCISGCLSWWIVANIYYWRVAKIDISLYFKSIGASFLKILFLIIGTSYLLRKMILEKSVFGTGTVFQIIIYTVLYVLIIWFWVLSNEDKKRLVYKTKRFKADY